MNHNHKCLLLVFLFLLLGGISMFTLFKERAENQESSVERNEASIWLTTGDQKNLLTQKSPLPFSKIEEKNIPTITIDRETKYQTMDGFGAAITGSSAYLINNKLNQSSKEMLLKDLFSANGIHISYVRHSIGGSDFSVDDKGNASNYTYADEEDISLSHFSVDKDQEVINVLQEARSQNQNLKIMGTPWTAPSWMKYGEKTFNGWYLDYTTEETYKAYADYFVRYIKSYEEKGLPIDSITIQNEPDFTSPNYPTMSMSAEEQAVFIGKYLGPALESNEIDTKIIAYDHNWEGASEFISTVFQNEDTNKYTEGTAFHCYKGTPESMTRVHVNFPDKHIYLSECSGGEWSEDFGDNLSWQMSNLIIGGPRNWAKTVLMWNTALDEKGGPTNGGCENCRGVVTINQETGKVTKNVEYYSIGHASKFVQAKAIRIASTSYPGIIETVAYENIDHSTVLIALNPSDKETRFQVNDRGSFFTYTLPPKSAVTFIWEKK